MENENLLSHMIHPYTIPYDAIFINNWPQFGAVLFLQ